MDIHTDRLLLTAFNKKHLTSRYVSWLNDKVLMQYSEQRHKKHTIESCRAYWERCVKGKNYFWAIEDEKNGFGHIGNITAYVDFYNSIADVALIIGHKDAGNMGYGFEAWKGVCEYLLSDGKIRKVTAGTLALNIPMLKIMNRLGMEDDGVRKSHYLIDGKAVDVIYKALFRK